MPPRIFRLAVVVGGVTLLTGAHADPGIRACVARTGPDYYAIDLVGTRNVPGMGLASGRADVQLSPSSPFSIAMAEDGSYRYEISVSLERMRAPRTGVLVAWVTTREVDDVQRIGMLDSDLRVTGSTSWNKFLVVVTLEPTDDPSAERWSGPVAFRGMSRSGMMHTMAGHGPFQQENCAAYGYDE